MTFGYRARIGLIYQGLIDSEFNLFVPKGVTVHIARYINSIEESQRFEGPWKIEEGFRLFFNVAIKQLTFIGVDSIALACTLATFTRGVDFDREIIKRIKDVSGGCPATTASSAVADALDTLGLRKIAVGTPYSDDLNIKLKKFLRNKGFEVVSMKSVKCISPCSVKGISRNLLAAGWDISRQPPEAVYQLAKEVDKPEAEGIFLSCTGLRTAEVLEDLEGDLGKPVISSNQALMWKALRLAGIKTSVKGYGGLLE